MGFLLATFGIIPLVMAGVALLVSDRVNRYANLIAGVAFGLFGVFAVVSHLLEGGFTVHVLMVALAGTGAFLIAGLSLAGLRHPTSELAAPASESSRPHETTTAQIGDTATPVSRGQVWLAWELHGEFRPHRSGRPISTPALSSA